MLPGPSAALAALVASALPADRWRFAGFLPRKRGELAALLGEAGGTLIAFESPRRVPATLALLAELDPDAAGGGLPGADQGARGGRAWHRGRAGGAFDGAPPKGEVVLVVGPATAAVAGAGEPEGLDQLRALVDAGAKPRPAAAAVAELTGGSANELYRALTS